MVDRKNALLEKIQELRNVRQQIETLANALDEETYLRAFAICEEIREATNELELLIARDEKTQ